MTVTLPLSEWEREKEKERDLLRKAGCGHYPSCTVMYSLVFPAKRSKMVLTSISWVECNADLCLVNRSAAKQRTESSLQDRRLRPQHQCRGPAPSGPTRNSLRWPTRQGPRGWPLEDWPRRGSAVKAHPAEGNKLPVGLSLSTHFSAPGTNFYISTRSPL